MRKFRTVFMVAMIFMLAVAPVLADGLNDTATENGIDVSPLYRVVLLCTGIIPGAFIAIKFFIDIIKAYAHREQDPSALMKAVINLVLVVFVILMYSATINFVFKTGSGSGSTQNQANANSSFLKGLSGDTVCAVDEPELLDAAYAEALLAIGTDVPAVL